MLDDIFSKNICGGGFYFIKFDNILLTEKYFFFRKKKCLGGSFFYKNLKENTKTNTNILKIKHREKYQIL